MQDSLYSGFIGRQQKIKKQKTSRCAGSYVGDAGILCQEEDNRPRERLLRGGASSLSDHELLAVILNTGIRGKNVAALAAELLDLLNREKDVPSVRELRALSGLGAGKACAVAAMLEFGRRRWGAAGTKIRQPQDIYGLLRHHANRKQERFLCLSLNGAHEVLALRIVSIGLVNRTIVHPREVFADPISDRAAAVIVAHNHPSGQLKPSPEDDEITARLKAAAEVLGLNFLDHLIFTEASWFSYRQNGRIDKISPYTVPAPVK
ncbi:MAG: DNA repair protein RadC [Treponema sp.]|jgi:DNA repair protein RadC|nr:DNA repair protein RadC [Treponema sp.]